MYDVVTIGTATRDAFIESPAFRIGPDKHFPSGMGLAMPAGAKIEVPHLRFTTGGGATNAAVTFARQGFRAACVVKVGVDAGGQEVIRTLKDEGVDTRFIATDPHEATAYAVLLLTASGERTILVHRGASALLTTADVPWDRLKTNWVYVLPGAAVQVATRAVREAKQRGARVALNPSIPMLQEGRAAFKALIKHADVIIMNREEASRITGVSYRDHARIFKALDAWVPCLAVLTDGERGTLVSDGATLYRAGVFRVKKLVDMTGAGDAFGSGFVSGLLRGARSLGGRMHARREGSAVCDIYPRDVVVEAVRLGAANAASVVEHLGAKEGILTASAVRREKRWQRLTVTACALA